VPSAIQELLFITGRIALPALSISNSNMRLATNAVLLLFLAAPRVCSACAAWEDCYYPVAGAAGRCAGTGSCSTTPNGRTAVGCAAWESCWYGRCCGSGKCPAPTPTPGPKYNESEALQFVYYSQAAFCTEKAITSWSCGSMCESAPTVAGAVRYIPEGKENGVQGYVAQIPGGSCLVAFRGSLNAKNWYADFAFELKPWPTGDRANASWCQGCYAHRGFAAAYEELRPAMRSYLQELNCSRLVVTGHSLGAAVATIASFDLRAALGFHVAAVWTFGKPRIGNPDFASSYMAAAQQQGVDPPLWRVVHYHDPVPRAPPNIPGVYTVAHSALEVYYNNKESSNYLVCPQVGATENQSAYCTNGWPLYLCVDDNHLTYLNQTFAFKNFPAECKTS